MVGAVLAAVAVLQSLATEFLGKKWDTLGSAYFYRQVTDDADGELGLPAEPSHKKYAAEVLHSTATLAATAIATMAALCASTLGCLATLVISITEDHTAVAIIMILNLLLIGVFLFSFVLHVSKADLEVHSRDRHPDFQPKTKNEEPKNLERWFNNLRYRSALYSINVRTPYVLTPYKTVLVISSAVCVVASTFL